MSNNIPYDLTRSFREVLETAQQLIDPDTPNPEYERALIELIGDLAGLPAEARWEIALALGLPSVAADGCARRAPAARTLNLNTAARIGDIIGSAERNAPIGRMIAGEGEVIYGQARAVVGPAGNGAAFAVGTDDVRDCKLWVTTNSGFDVFWPIAELEEELAKGYFVIDYVPPRGVSTS